MIYLIESGDYYKIGYAENLEKRLKAYNTHNPDYKVVDTIEGSKYYETLLHKLCAEYNKRSEWFIKCNEVLILWNNFKNIIPVIEKLQQDLNKANTKIEKLQKEVIDKNNFIEDFRMTYYKDMQFINNIKNCRQQHYPPLDEFLKFIDNYVEKW